MVSGAMAGWRSLGIVLIIYLHQASSVYDCDFDKNTFCTWTQDNTSDVFDWTLTNGATSSSNTGPAADHTTGSNSGYYVYIETSSGSTGHTARLVSQSMQLMMSGKCLNFWYHMFGVQVNRLNVYITEGGYVENATWTKYGNQGNVWKFAAVHLTPESLNPPSSEATIQIIFEGVHGGTYQGDIAIDDISVNDGPCPIAMQTIALSPPDTTYTKNEGDTLPNITCDADCYPSCTFVWSGPDDTDFPASPVLSLDQLDSSEDGTYTCTARNGVWEATIETSIAVVHDPEHITFTPQDDLVDRFENQTIPDVTCSADCTPACVYTWSKGGSIYPDPLSLSTAVRDNAGQYTCTADNNVGSITKTWNLVVRSPSAYDCDFNQNTLCTWTQDMTSDEFGWSLKTGRVYSSNTGQIIDHTTSSSSGYYAYIDTATHGRNDTARLVSQSMRLKSSGNCLKFWYHMSGVYDVSRLKVYATKGGNLENAIWARYGNQGNFWKFATVYLTPASLNLPSSQATTQIIIEGAMSSRYRGIIAIDDISVTDGPCPISNDSISMALSPPESTYTVEEGRYLHDITCRADCMPNCTLVWTRPDNTDFPASPVLSLDQLDRSEHGTYRCIARSISDTEEASISTSITVQYAPTSMTLSPADRSYTRNAGDTLPNITCTAYCRPSCTFGWTQYDTTFLLASSVLSLEQLDRSEQGKYICEARNGIGEATISTRVNVVRYPPKIRRLFYSYGGADVRENRSKSLICTVDSYPASTIRWYYKANNTELHTAPGTRRSIYTLTRAGCLDTGTYTCSAINSETKTPVTRDISVNVLCKPRPDFRVQVPNTYGLALSDNLAISPSFISNPEPSYTWTFQSFAPSAAQDLSDGGDNFTTHNKYNENTLSAISVGTRQDIQEKWFGLYIVTATNDHGSYTLTFSVYDKDYHAESGGCDPSPVSIGLFVGSAVFFIVCVVLVLGVGSYLKRKGIVFRNRNGNGSSDIPLDNVQHSHANVIGGQQEMDSASNTYEQMQPRDQPSVYDDLLPAKQGIPDSATGSNTYEQMQPRDQPLLYDDVLPVKQGIPDSTTSDKYEDVMDQRCEQTVYENMKGKAKVSRKHKAKRK